jgi:hypothetical protein
LRYLKWWSLVCSDFPNAELASHVAKEDNNRGLFGRN